MDEIVRCSITLPENLLKAVDERVAQTSTRSEFIRDLIKERLVNEAWNNKNSVLMGVLTIIYDHHQSDLVFKKMNLEHDADIDIFCTTHVHIDHHNCLEVLVIKGDGDKIEHFCNQISGLKGVNFASLTKTAVI
ncbi:nickel-responsive transcriptional regulator NikR [Campylobacter corcagiensis]|uniref:Putative nickel-responsive regulator n=1 Tax=Campylobacter corcagiensis TaxID=1448857 RepID=A0A7M1LF92_9BACT|nr:nickel-responsive transcriptional regulator NikR [Campylobacter corcagiensis]QKF64736.1 nickel responsive regulator [Campylobacter corcagiensis]QOQ87100.1 nickel-responsive transcriptional regulator NikR [Campylobacter corcagiensis]